MPPSFHNARVVLFEARLADETAALVRRLGGEPMLAPALAEHDLDAGPAVQDLCARLAARSGELVILLTGVAVTRLFEAADRLGRGADLTAGLQRSTVLARGPKPTGALARRGITTAVPVPSPYTTAEVIAALDHVNVDRRDVTLVHYGERSEELVAALEARGARLHEMLLYEWRLPDDVGPLSEAIDAIIDGDVQAAAFTSQVQVRHAMQVAGDRREALVAALNERVLVGAVGPTCAAACRAAGIDRVIVPEQPKLAPLLMALAAAGESRDSRPG